MTNEAITREFTIDASPETVYEVITDAGHLSEWWPDHAELEATVGANGTIWFGEPGEPDTKVVALRVLEADPPRRFAFRWAFPADEEPTESNSLLVTFDLEADGVGTRVRFSEVGFTTMAAWGPDEAEARYQDHTNGWNHYLPRLVDHGVRVGAS